MKFGSRYKKTSFYYVKNLIRNLFSFSRTRKYISLSIKRIKGSPHELALGIATGISISFTPFIGFHTLLAIFISWIIGGSMAAAVIGTLFGNPWTFPFFWYLTYEVGQFLYQGTFNYEEFSFNNIKKEITTLLTILKYIFLSANLKEIKNNFLMLNVIPIMSLGAIPLVLISWSISYIIFLNIFKSYKNRIIKDL